MMNENPSSAVTGYRAPAVARAFDILAEVANARGDAGISELARRLDLSKSTVHGLVRSLFDIGVLEQNPQTKKFCLGPALVELAFKSWNFLQVREKAQPEINRIRDRIGETVFLGLLSREEATIIATAEADKPLKISSPPGTSIPLLTGAVGKIAMAQLGTEAARAYLQSHALPRFTDRSIIDLEDYLEEIDRVRERQGFAIDDGEYLPGVRAVAAPLDNRRGLPLAVWVVGFSTSMSDDRLGEIAQQTVSGAQALRRRLDV
jgi:DNA-binding IclR family transcriptional regulator